MTTIAARIQIVQHRIQTALRNHGRADDSITLLAVSKRQPVRAIEQAYKVGLRCFGENQVQEALPKIKSLQKQRIEWHFIGTIQSNKTRVIAQYFDWVHGIDRAKTAQRLSDQRPATLPPLQVCIQVDSSLESSKGGIALEQVPELACLVATLPRLRLRGLMTIPAPRTVFSEQQISFRMLRDSLRNLQTLDLTVDTLSMGMSGDLEAAIAEGSTLLRVGTALFGPRTYTVTK